MKKTSLIILSAVLFAGTARADFVEANKTLGYAGGFLPLMKDISAVEQVKKMKDDTDVVVQGKILRHIKGDKYLFEDSTGTIIVEIEREDWRGQIITPKDEVKLYGEVDSGLFKTEIEVDYVEKITACGT